MWATELMHYWKVEERIFFSFLHHICPKFTSILKWLWSQKYLCLKELLLGNSTFISLYQPVYFWCEIPQVALRKNFLNFLRSFAKLFFLARFFIGIPGDNPRFEKYEISVKNTSNWALSNSASKWTKTK